MADALWEARHSVANDLDTILRESGQRAGTRQPSRAYLEKLTQFTEFMADIFEGKRPRYLLQEAMSTSDFPLLMGDTLQRQLLGRYQETPVTWPAYARRGSVPDFRTVKRFTLDGLEGRFYPSGQRQELSEPGENNELTETKYEYAVDVYERAVALDWKMLVNADLGEFRDFPDRLAKGARRSEEYFATQLFVDANGPHASFYTAGNANIVNTTNGASSTNPALSITAMQDAMTILGNMQDADNEPIAYDMVVLVVPPALAITAKNILNATELRLNAAGGATNEQLIVNNWMRNNLTLVVNPYIPIIASSANGNSSWFMFASPSVSRPALEVGFMQGYEQPGIYQKTPNTMRVGGGAAPELGDFDTNEIRYKAMHIMGGVRLDPKATLASNGSGS